MNNRLAAIIARRQTLIARADQQRHAFVADARRWRAPLAFVDIGFAVGRAVRSNPALFIGAATLLVYVPKARLAIWIGRALGAWELYRVLRMQWPGRRNP